MSDTCRGGEVAPYTFAAMDPFDQIQIVGMLSRRRHERAQAEREIQQVTEPGEADEPPSSLDQLDAEGEQ